MATPFAQNSPPIYVTAPGFTPPSIRTATPALHPHYIHYLVIITTIRVLILHARYDLLKSGPAKLFRQTPPPVHLLNPRPTHPPADFPSLEFGFNTFFRVSR
jgi:hypothetical protein